MYRYVASPKREAQRFTPARTVDDAGTYGFVGSAFSECVVRYSSGICTLYPVVTETRGRH